MAQRRDVYMYRCCFYWLSFISRSSKETRYSWNFRRNDVPLSLSLSCTNGLTNQTKLLNIHSLICLVNWISFSRKFSSSSISDPWQNLSSLPLSLRMSSPFRSNEFVSSTSRFSRNSKQLSSIARDTFVRSSLRPFAYFSRRRRRPFLALLSVVLFLSSPPPICPVVFSPRWCMIIQQSAFTEKMMIMMMMES